MADIDWVPLDLWRASKLQTETREVQRLWADAVEAGDDERLRALKASIEARNDELEHFYVRHSSDQRAVLFEKQRLTLRALLQHAATAAAARATSPARAGPVSPASPGMDATWRSGGRPSSGTRGQGGLASSGGSGRGGEASGVTDDSRLELEAFRAWFRAEGRRQVPGLPSKQLAAVFYAVADSSEVGDGKMSVRELRRWFFAVFRKGGWKPGEESASKPSGRRPRVPIYEFEAKALARSAASDAAAASPARVGAAAGEQHVGMPGASLVFDVVLTPEEYSALSLRRRAMEAEKKDTVRRQQARQRAERARKESASRGGLFTADLSRDALLKDSAFVDSDKMERFIFRSAKPDNWVDDSDFRTR